MPIFNNAFFFLFVFVFVFFFMSVFFLSFSLNRLNKNASQIEIYTGKLCKVESIRNF